MLCKGVPTMQKNNKEQLNIQAIVDSLVETILAHPRRLTPQDTDEFRNSLIQAVIDQNVASTLHSLITVDRAVYYLESKNYLSSIRK